MSFIFYLLIFINLVWVAYLTFIFYKKIINKPNLPSNQESKLKIKITRFNPFEDIGGDQSFILSILDENNSGAVITSLHNRDITRIYAKPIKNGEGDNITLSKEEKLAIVKTIKS